MAFDAYICYVYAVVCRAIRYARHARYVDTLHMSCCHIAIDESDACLPALLAVTLPLLLMFYYASAFDYAADLHARRRRARYADAASMVIDFRVIAAFVSPPSACLCFYYFADDVSPSRLIISPGVTPVTIAFRQIFAACLLLFTAAFCRFPPPIAAMIFCRRWLIAR